MSLEGWLGGCAGLVRIWTTGVDDVDPGRVCGRLSEASGRRVEGG